MTTTTTTTMTWKAGRLVCRASGLLRFGGCRCPVEGPAEAVQLPLPTTDTRFEGLQTSLGITSVFEIPVKRFDIGHLEFDGKERIIDHKKNVEDFKFGIW